MKLKRYHEMWVGDQVVGRLVGDVSGREGGTQKYMLFGGVCSIYVHYFKDICRGALQSDCVIVFGCTLYCWEY